MLPFPFPLPQIPSNVDQKSAEPRRENRESMSVEEVGKIDTREEARNCNGGLCLTERKPANSHGLWTRHNCKWNEYLWPPIVATSGWPLPGGWLLAFTALTHWMQALRLARDIKRGVCTHAPTRRGGCARARSQGERERWYTYIYVYSECARNVQRDSSSTTRTRTTEDNASLRVREDQGSKVRRWRRAPATVIIIRKHGERRREDSSLIPAYGCNPLSLLVRRAMHKAPGL